jgi:hypothetical protein
MAELEIARHGKKAIQSLTKREHPLAHRLGEMALEIFTIVFAVTLSIWLHGLSEHRHEQQQVETFLTGLKTDLKGDIALLDNVAKSHHAFDANFGYLAGLDPAGKPDPEKFDGAYMMVLSNFFFQPQLSRFEGFKSSGKLINIENQELLNDILVLYQSYAGEIENSEGGWRRRHNKLLDYFEERADIGDSAAQRYAAVVAPKGKRMLQTVPATPQMYERYDSYAALARKIMKTIDKAYPGAAPAPK